MLQPLADARALFAHADYRRVWMIGGLSGIARWLEFVAIAIFAYELTHSPELVALLAVLRMVPYVMLGFLMGALADAIDRKRLLLASLSVMAATSAAMSALAISGRATYAAAAVVVMVAGAFWTTDMPVRRRLLVDAVEGGNVAAALGFDNATMYATRALGPLIGGATYQALGIGGIYALIAASYLVCLWLAAGLRAGSEHQPSAAPARMGLGFLLPPRELILDRRFQVIMGVTLVYNLWCWPFVTMVPVIAQKDFALTPALVGALSACDGLGGTLGALAVGLLAGQRTLFRFYYLGTLSFLLLVLALSLHLTVGTAIGVLLLLGRGCRQLLVDAVCAGLHHRPARDARPRHRRAVDLHRLIHARPLAHRPAVRAAGLRRRHAHHGGRRHCRNAGAGDPVVAHARAARRIVEGPGDRSRGLRIAYNRDRPAQIEPLIQSCSCFFCVSAPTRSADLLAVLEDHQRRHRLDVIFLRHFRVLVDVELGDLDLALHLGRHLLQRRRHGLARPAPLGEEIDQHRLGRLAALPSRSSRPTRRASLPSALDQSPWVMADCGGQESVGRNVGRPPSGVKARRVELPEPLLLRRRASSSESP